MRGSGRAKATAPKNHKTFRDMASLPAPPPPPPPPPTLAQLPLPSEDSGHSASPSPSSSSSLSFANSPSLLIIAAIIAFVFVASATIHLLLRFLSRSSSSPSSSSPPLIHHRRSSSTSSALSDQQKATLIESLPLFSLASSVSVLPQSSPDCAVCLSPFHPHDELRLLPACRHAFHSPCIDTWLRSTPSCPLCRSSVTLPAPSLPPLLPSAATAEDPPRSSSFRIEIGSVSRRRMPSEEDASGTAASLPTSPPPPPSQPHLRSYSLGSSFEYVVDEEVEAVVARIRRAKEYKVEPVGPSPPGAEVAEAAGGGRNWLKEYVDWLASSASSSFSSLRFSGRWSHRYDDGVGGGGRDPRDVEGNYQQREEEEEGSYHSFYRWLVGA